MKTNDEYTIAETPEEDAQLRAELLATISNPETDYDQLATHMHDQLHAAADLIGYTAMSNMVTGTPFIADEEKTHSIARMRWIAEMCTATADHMERIEKIANLTPEELRDQAMNFMGGRLLDALGIEIQENEQ